jgi:hypothetical protein
MKSAVAALLLSIVAVVLAGASWWQTSHRPAAAPVPAAVEPPEEPKYPLGEEMLKLQRLCAKLELALDRGDLTLATFYHYEMEAIAEDIVVHGVLFNEKRIGYMMSRMLQPPLGHLGAHLQNRDLVKSREMYSQMLSSCNACHAEASVRGRPIVPPEFWSDL